MKRWAWAALVLAGPAWAQGSAPTDAGEQRCLDAFRGEVARIERDLARRAPPKNDAQAQQAWSVELHRALQLAGDRAEACSRAARAPQAAAAARAEAACAARITQAGEALQRRYAGRSLSVAEQTALRQEETRLIDERNACRQAGVRR